MDKRPLHETHPHLKEFTAFLDELNRESARGAVLVSSSMIDGLLRRTILSFLIQREGTEKLLDGFNAPLGTFSARILTAVSLGVISETEYQDCQVIRNIRNAFAHDVNVSFENSAISDACSKLMLSAKDYDDVRVDARGRFTTAAVWLILNLTNRPHYAAQRRLCYVTWPY
jgi:hypothetical protein